MTSGERVQLVRKELNMTLEKFGNALGVTKVAISNIEKGNRSLTEQMAKAICREFHVSPTWLESGDGEMFEDYDHVIQDKIDDIMTGENEFHKQLIKSIVDLDLEQIKLIEKIVKDLYESTKKEVDK